MIYIFYLALMVLAVFFCFREFFPDLVGKTLGDLEIEITGDRHMVKSMIADIKAHVEELGLEVTEAGHVLTIKGTTEGFANSIEDLPIDINRMTLKTSFFPNPPEGAEDEEPPMTMAQRAAEKAAEAKEEEEAAKEEAEAAKKAKSEQNAQTAQSSE